MNFLEHFEQLEGPRSHVNRKHNLLDIHVSKKGNQGNLQKEIQAYFHKCYRDNALLNTFSEIDVSHG